MSEVFTLPEDVLFCWSGGKDSAMALHALQSAHEYRVTALLTTITEGYDRISMHGVRRALLEPCLVRPFEREPVDPDRFLDLALKLGVRPVDARVQHRDAHALAREPLLPHAVGVDQLVRPLPGPAIVVRRRSPARDGTHERDGAVFHDLVARQVGF